MIRLRTALALAACACTTHSGTDAGECALFREIAGHGPRPPMSRDHRCYVTEFDPALVAPLLEGPRDEEHARVVAPNGCWAVQAIYTGRVVTKLEGWQPQDTEPSLVWEYDPGGARSTQNMEFGESENDFIDRSLHRKTVRLGPGHVWVAVHRVPAGSDAFVQLDGGKREPPDRSGLIIDRPRQFKTNNAY
jgi:hypothetical protein